MDTPMNVQESIDARLARIEEHIKSIDLRLSEKYYCCRHVTGEGECDFYTTVVEHDRKLSQWGPDIAKIDEHERKINQWTGAMSAVSLISSFVGGLSAFVLTKFWR